MRSSAIFFVSVVTSTRSPFVTRSLMFSMRSSIWPFVGLTIDLRVDEPGRAHDLLDHLLGHPQLVRAGRRRHEHALVDPLEDLLERQRAVVARRRQPEAVVDEHVLAAAVALVLAVQLRHRLVALVDDEQEVVGEVVEQRERRLAEVAAVDVHRVVLDAVAVADLGHHLEVVLRAHAQALGLEQLALLLEPGEPLLQLGLDLAHRPLHPLGAGDVVGGREDLGARQLAQRLAGDRVDDRRAGRPCRRTSRCAAPSPRRTGAPRWCRRGPGSAPGRAPGRCGRTAGRRGGAGCCACRSRPRRRGRSSTPCTPRGCPCRRCTRPTRRR